ncbi:MAG: FtsW/RodA/SpoVE family cell cycle protein [Alistipes sp.]|nr:FtsW/RodA/SpoVE family cell cycle protein [Alistipes sp.]
MTLRPGGDVALWIIVAVLAAMSVLVVYSSTGVEALSPDGSGNHFGVLIRQLGIVLMGLMVVYAVHKINYQFYGRIVWAAYAMALAFTVMVFFIGEANPGAPNAPRWIRIPLLNMTFQPSDFLKVATVMVLARELARRQKTIDREPVLPPFSARGWREDGGGRILREQTIPLLGPIALSCAVIFSTNLSTALILLATCFVMLFIGRVRIRELMKFMFAMFAAGVVVAGTAFAINTLNGSGNSGGGEGEAGGAPTEQREEVLSRSGTWKNRIDRFLRGEKSYQVEQAEIAIAVGGLMGRGAGESTQRGILPDAESDYAYAFVIEEYGSLLGGGLVILLYLWIFFRGIVIFRKCGTAFPSLLVLGLALLITIQAMVNMMVSTNMIPSTGIALPLISKGGSSELFLSCALGMMLGVSRQTSEQTLDKPRAESLLEN